MKGFAKPLKAPLKIFGRNFFIPRCWSVRILSARIVWQRRGYGLGEVGRGGCVGDGGDGVGTGGRRET